MIAQIDDPSIRSEITLRARQQQNSSRPLFLYLSFFTKPYSAYGERRGPTKLRQLSEMDAAVGGVVAELARAGEMDNTIVMFVSDNGAREAEPGTASANYPLREHSHRACLSSYFLDLMPIFEF